MTTKSEAPKVYAAIAKVAQQMSIEGIAKTRQVQYGEKYRFRGIDDVFQALSPVLADVGLCILPRVLARSVVEREGKNGGAMFYVVLDVEFDLVATEDGSKHTIRIFGEAMDTSDKATNKAMSAAYKYACLQSFCIPLEGASVDVEVDNHQPAATKKDKPEPAAKKEEPKGPETAKTEPKKRDASEPSPVEIEIREGFLNAKTVADIAALAKRAGTERRAGKLDDAAMKRIVEAHDKALAEVKGAAA